MLYIVQYEFYLHLYRYTYTRAHSRTLSIHIYIYTGRRHSEISYLANQQDATNALNSSSYALLSLSPLSLTLDRHHSHTTHSGSIHHGTSIGDLSNRSGSSMTEIPLSPSSVTSATSKLARPTSNLLTEHARQLQASLPPTPTASQPTITTPRGGQNYDPWLNSSTSGKNLSRKNTGSPNQSNKSAMGQNYDQPSSAQSSRQGSPVGPHVDDDES